MAVLSGHHRAAVHGCFLGCPLGIQRRIQFVAVSVSKTCVPVTHGLFPGTGVILSEFRVVRRLKHTFLGAEVTVVGRFSGGSLPCQTLGGR